MTRHAALVLLALLVMLVATCRARSRPASGSATVYLPVALHHHVPTTGTWPTPAPWAILASTSGLVCRISETKP